MADIDYDPNESGDNSASDLDNDISKRLRSADKNKPPKKRRGRRKKVVKPAANAVVLLEIGYYIGQAGKRIEAIGEDEVDPTVCCRNRECISKRFCSSLDVCTHFTVCTHYVTFLDIHSNF